MSDDEEKPLVSSISYPTIDNDEAEIKQSLSLGKQKSSSSEEFNICDRLSDYSSSCSFYENDESNGGLPEKTRAQALK